MERNRWKEEGGRNESRDEGGRNRKREMEKGTNFRGRKKVREIKEKGGR